MNGFARPSNRPVAITLRIYRALANAFPHEFKSIYGDEMLEAANDAVEPVWRRHGIFGLVRLLLDVAIRLPAEYLIELRRDIRHGAGARGSDKRNRLAFAPMRPVPPVNSFSILNLGRKAST